MAEKTTTFIQKICKEGNFPVCVSDYTHTEKTNVF